MVRGRSAQTHMNATADQMGSVKCNVMLDGSHPMLQVVLHVCIAKGESPIWSGVDDVLYFVDIDGKAIHSYDPRTGAHDSLQLTTMVGAVRVQLSLFNMNLRHDAFTLLSNPIHP